MGGYRAKLIAAIIFIGILVIAAVLLGYTEKGSQNGVSTVDSKENLLVHFLDVGEGDSILLQFAGKNVLIDGGEPNMGSRVVSYLKDHGVSGLDLVVATHPHSDHIGGLIEVLKTFPVKQVLDSGQKNTSQIYENFLTIIDQKNIPFKIAERGQKINLDPRLNINVLSPTKIKLGDLNDNSIVLKLTYGNVSFLFVGDAGKPEENSLLSSGYNLHANILKVGHHGSSESSSPKFLQVVSPKVSIIETGANNQYGDPAPVTLKSLGKIGSTIYRTDLNGNIDVTSNGMTYSVSVQKGAK